MNAVELHAEQTRAFVDASPLSLLLSRADKQDDPAGGKRIVGHTPLPEEQMFRLVTLRNPRIRHTPDGKEVVVDQVLVGAMDVDVEVDDQFTYQGTSYQVVSVFRRSIHQRTVAEVAGHG